MTALKATIVRFLPTAPFAAAAVFTRGEPRLGGRGRKRRGSGFNVVVSYADGSDLPRQARETLEFLRRHGGALKRLRADSGFRSATLDFGLYDMSSEERPWPSYKLDADLVSEAGRHGFAIDLSFYGTPDDAPGSA